jgi:membrane-bound metal-dependent hydrolase YbcI (DUF457 family)
MFFPIFSLGFFLGYTSHLVADSYTIWGIKPFYPSKKVVKGKIRSGGRREEFVFLVFLVLDLAFVLSYLFL